MTYLKIKLTKQQSIWPIPKYQAKQFVINCVDKMLKA